MSGTLQDRVEKHNTSGYPTRERFFALKFVRLLGRLGVGGEVGADACWLLTLIVTTEDATGYARPVAYYADDLAARAGMSVSSLQRARQRAVAAGWLHYEPGAKRRPARYHVLIPADAEAVGGSGGDPVPVQADPEPDPPAVDCSVNLAEDFLVVGQSDRVSDRPSSLEPVMHFEAPAWATTR